jgi:hypothetical protein
VTDIDILECVITGIEIVTPDGESAVDAILSDE